MIYALNADFCEHIKHKRAFSLRVLGDIMSEVSCPKCGRKAPADAMFCPDCGASLDAQSVQPARMLVVTTPTLPGYRIVKVLGAAYGLTVRTRGVGGKFIAGIEGMFGGEVTSYSSEAEKARRESLQRLIDNAVAMGANAVIGADFETSDILQGTATLFSAYGTAVIVEPTKDAV
jgi:uncharacterized protein YbjQ (UPF0145 family)